jgi:hypothetical protein
MRCRAELSHNRAIKHAVFVRAFEELCRHGYSTHNALALIDKSEKHHIRPLSLGGTNDLDNFAVVEKNLHKAIHTYINAQLGPDMDSGKRIIMIPHHPENRIVWTCGIPFRGVPIKCNGGQCDL